MVNSGGVTSQAHDVIFNLSKKGSDFHCFLFNEKIHNFLITCLISLKFVLLCFSILSAFITSYFSLARTTPLIKVEKWEKHISEGLTKIHQRITKLWIFKVLILWRHLRAALPYVVYCNFHKLSFFHGSWWRNGSIS